MGVKSTFRKIRKGVKGFIKGMSGGSVSSAFKRAGNAISKAINYKQDAPRRELAREINSQKAKLNYEAKRLEKFAELNAGSRTSLMSKAEKLRNLANQLSAPEMQKSRFGIDKIKMSNQPEYLEQYRQNLERVFSQFTQNDIKSERAKLRNIASENAALEKQKRSNAIFAEQLKIAADRGETLFFGKGDAARAQALQFFNYYKPEWQGEPGDRYAAILVKHPGKTLYDLYNEMFEDSEATGQSWWEFVAEWLGLDYDNIDTTSVAWQSSVESEFAALDSPQQDAISAAWAAMH